MRRAATVPMGGLEVRLGKMVELTRDDARELAERTYMLQVLVKHQKPGWFAAYVMGVKDLNKLIQAIVRRSDEA